jgi:protein-S-isoprenylcysteine O-methyltransferase Ste14
MSEARSQTTVQGMDRSHARSLLQKGMFAFFHLLIVLICAALLYAEGWEAVGDYWGEQWRLVDPTRATLLFLCVLLYWIRHLMTLFYLLQRKVSASEVFGLLGFFAVFEIGLLLIGGGAFREEVIAFNGLDVVALFLLLSGSYLNSFSEIQRKRWKADPANTGHCYTQGLFRYSMHINFFGDVVLFTGWSLLSTSFWALALPLLMALLFVFFHIPSLDVYLAHRYGDEFKVYASRTKKLIPFVY